MSQWAAGLLPTPHLLDAAWWFDRATVEAFRLTIEALPRRASLVFLGTPSLFLDACQRGKGRTSLLVDRDRTIQARLAGELSANCEVLDLLRELPRSRTADFVVADPPWYPSEIRAFLASAQAVARVGAQVQICLPPLGTRPTIIQEREELFRWASAGGLRLVRLFEGKVRYVAPPFEVNVFRSTRTPLEEQSRSGDLAVFTVCSKAGLVLPPQPMSVIWADHTILDVRWRVREESVGGEGSPELTSLGFLDDIFPSCSKRHDDRAKPAVWTSGNRAFRCENPQRFLAILRSLDGATVQEVTTCAASIYPKVVSREARAAAQIVALLEVEQSEIEAIKRCPNGKET